MPLSGYEHDDQAGDDTPASPAIDVYQRHLDASAHTLDAILARLQAGQIGLWTT